MPRYRIAIFSDVHANLEALEAVLEDAAKQEVSEMLCLGDIVGYGPNPAECVDLIRRSKVLSILGNHDQACDDEVRASKFHPLARAGIEYSRRALSREQRRWLSNLPDRLEFSTFTAVHATLDPFQPWTYILSEAEAVTHFGYQDTALCFCGHTHRPAIWRKSKVVKQLKFEPKVKLSDVSRYLVNAGSVGQPRDFGNEACYLIFDVRKNEVTYRFVPYYFTKTQIKIRMAGLPEFLAERLEMGN